MKFFVLAIFGMIYLGGTVSAQKSDRLSNPDYMWKAFEENFSVSHLDRNVWNPTSRFKRNLGFLVDNTQTVKLEKGNLELKMQHVPNYLDSLWTFKGWRHELSHYIGAEVSTRQKFKYGIFECRAKYALRSGSWPAFWLTANDGIPCPPGTHGSEIDIAEVSCVSDFPLMMHVIHRYYPTVKCDSTLQVKKDEKRYHIPNRQKFAIYKCIWTPEKIEYFINDKMVHEVINQGLEWFPAIPMNLILSQQVTQGFDLAREISPVAPQTSYFDWVRVRQFFLAPEITCPDSISTEATATMDVDQLASEINWKLSPADGFIPSEGKGTTAQIVRASHTKGKGKITFTFQMPSGETYQCEKTFE